MSATVSVCIATYRRNEQLRALLDDLARQVRLPDQVVIVDNDATGAARAIVEQFRALPPPFALDYDVQPEPNIALTRNRTVELASGEWLAFIDDDERAPPTWLHQLLLAAERYQADGVLGPVEPQVPATAPAWILRGRFYDFPHQSTGAVVPLNCLRFGNVLFRARWLRTEPGPFDRRHGLAPGEDLDLLVRLAHRGARIIWSEEARVYEPIEPKRLSLKWLMLRALSGGQGFARWTVTGRLQPISWAGCWLFYLGALVRLALACALALLTWPLGQHHAAAWLIRAAANVGKISSLWGLQYRNYARSAQAGSARAGSAT